MFGPLDHVILFGLLVLFGCLGYYYGPYKNPKGAKPATSRVQPTASASGQIHKRTMNSQSGLQIPTRPYVANIISLFMNYISATAVLGLPAAIFNNGVQYWMVIFAFPLAVLIVDRLFIEVFFMERLLTPFEYLEKRFGFRIRAMVFCVFIVQNLLLSSLALYVPAYAFSQMSGFEFEVCLTILASVGIFYTALGGIKAVVHIGEIQAGILVFAILTITIRGLVVVGGFPAVSKATHEDERTLEIWDFSPAFTDNRVTLISGLVSVTIHWAQVYGYHQAAFSRYSVMQNLETARKVVRWQCLLMPLFYSLLTGCGLIMFTYFHCDVLGSGEISKGEELLPYFVERIHFPGIEGIFIGGVVSAALSSLSATVNSLSYGLLYDIINPLISKSEGSLVRPIVVKDYTRPIAIVIGFIAFGITFFASRLTGVLKLRSIIYHTLGSPGLGVFLLGLLNPWCESNGATAAYISGLVWGIYLAINHYINKPPYYPILRNNCTNESSSDESRNSFSFGNFTTMTYETSRVTDISFMSSGYTEMTGHMNRNNGTLIANQATGVKGGGLTNPQYIAWWRSLPAIQRINNQYFGISCLILTFVVGSLVSVFKRDKDVIPRLLTPCVKSLYIKKSRETSS